ncbi:Oligopeptide transport ATP-binding protein OppF [Fervidicola ferrireducens]|uniref:Oligopeptide transport ATP-binding protein OppF n=1 Tax=Fervidicola ferrireducens TaxID=520764 RepID=A0A140LDB3_9FIRM|nr:ABC transporter ATP-binding protein [Fervidicola ferrireducens]KXG78538.1 Oligopeptide transport ATP-binding protein OppF [Fervidicola ferrireducens]
METIVVIDNVKKFFNVTKGLFKKHLYQIRAVDGVSFEIKRGETFGLVGESGSGKTTVARLVMRLTDPTENTIFFKGKDIFKAKGKELKDIRRRMSMVFQDPAASLNPRATILDSIKRPLEIYGYKKSEIKAIVEDTIEKVALGKELLNRYPHQLSGGQQQRASIARALVLKPEFMVLDEPTSALDVSVQAQILNILLEIQERYNLTYLFITHNLSVVRYVSDRIGVMYLGKIVEIAQVDEIYSSPLHPYTAGLLSSAPSLSPRGRSRKKLLLSGDPPSLINPPPGCRLYPRCPYAEKICREEIPELREVKTDHFVACHRAGELDFSGIVRW